LILDCCEAGQTVSKWIPNHNDYFRILTATGPFDTSKELDGLKAGVFTYHLYRALTEPQLRIPEESGVINVKGEIWVNKLFNWLDKEIETYGQQKERNLSRPNLYGPASKNVMLSEGLIHSFIAPLQLEKLHRLLLEANYSC